MAEAAVVSSFAKTLFPGVLDHETSDWVMAWLGSFWHHQNLPIPHEPYRRTEKKEGTKVGEHQKRLTFHHCLPPALSFQARQEAWNGMGQTRTDRPRPPPGRADPID